MTNPNQNTVVPDDPFGSLKKELGPSGIDPRVVAKIHARDDTDAAQYSHHHTLGIKHDQASAGDHSHDGSSSRKVGAGLSLTCDTGVSTAVDLANLFTMLHKIVEFTEV